MKFESLLAVRTKKMGVSAMREILKVVSQPGMVSLAGGIPAPESFPMAVINDLLIKVLDKYSSSAFQYDPTEGFSPLREALASYLKNMGIEASFDEVLIATGSQGVLDSIGKILISEGDKVAVEAPTYLGAIQAFNPYGPEYISIETDDDGMIPEALETALKKHRIKFIYLVPTFQNPTGRTLPYERRKEIAQIIKKNDSLLIEDDPYSALRYRGDTIASIKTLAPDNVIYVGTLSKVFAPGLRIGFYVAPELFRRWLVVVKQGIDLHSSTFNQALAAEYLSGGHLEKHLPKILSIYKPRQEAMLSALETYFPPEFSWSKPDGGMFIWAEGPKGLDMEKIYWKAIEKKTAFVPGKFFFTEKGEGIETMRLNYTMTDEGKIYRAVRTLSELIRQEMTGVL